MAAVKSFEELECWKTARMLCKHIGKLIGNRKFSSDFKLVNQIRASSGSGMDNIAEGFERGGNREFIQFLFIAKGSIGETKSQLYRSLDQKYISQEEFNMGYEIAETCSKQISRLANYLLHTDRKGIKSR